MGMPVADSVRICVEKEMSKLLVVQFRQDIDPREQPLYTVKEAASYLGVDAATLATWFFGRRYQTKSEGQKLWNRVIVPADDELRLLSFFNLAEAHILAATRYHHKVPFPAVRDAIAHVQQDFPASAAHPLLSNDFYTNGSHLFVKELQRTLDVSRQQPSFKSIMNKFIKRVVSDKHDKPFKVFPLAEDEKDDRIISIVSGVSHSRPIIEGTGIPALAVWRRYKAGEDPRFLAKDYRVRLPKIERAIDYIERRAA
jgi:uncharacterized protein (DUF433 family)